jgi:serine/threonine protein kinase
MNIPSPALPGAAATGQATVPATLCVPDHQLLRAIGRGSYGEVWLAQNVMGTWRAVKVVYRHTFEHERPFEREFNGIQKFEPVSRLHSALVQILHVGRNHDLGYFYYVMELADAAKPQVSSSPRPAIGQQPETLNTKPETYNPRTLRSELQGRGRLPVDECVAIGLTLTDGLAYLHGRGLIHRDIKPANIIFVNGQPKIADIGLVTDIGEAATFVGTQGYIPPEGPGTPSADLYSLGMVLYEISLGKDRQHFPELPSDLDAIENISQLIALNHVILKACANSATERYRTAQEMHADLRRVQDGRTLEGTESNVVRATPPPASKLLSLESVGGAVPLDSRFYMLRPTDEEFRAAIARRDSVVLVKGARQVGKTSLLARGLQQARQAGARVVLTDFQSINAAHFGSAETLLQALAEWVATELSLEAAPLTDWNPRSGPNINFQRFLRRHVLENATQPVVWGLDEVDRLFTCPFGSEIFGLFRSWHNARSLDPAGPWSRLTLAIAYATEAHLFITDINQSPFNVGTRLALDDFTLEQVADLNRRHGSPLTHEELARFFEIVGGHPYLVRCGLHEVVARNLTLDQFEKHTERDEGLFGDHLRRMLVLLANEAGLGDVVRRVIQGQPCPTAESFYRLRAAGIISGDSAGEARPRCQLYAAYLSRHLL